MRLQVKEVVSLKLLLELMIVLNVTVNQQIVWDLEFYCCYNTPPPHGQFHKILREKEIKRERGPKEKESSHLPLKRPKDIQSSQSIIDADVN